MENNLELAKETIKKMTDKKLKLTTIYKNLRKQSRFVLIGDYPLIAQVARTAGTFRKLTPREITNVLRIAVDQEFQNVHSDNEIVMQLYAQFRTKNCPERLRIAIYGQQGII